MRYRIGVVVCWLAFSVAVAAAQAATVVTPLPHEYSQVAARGGQVVTVRHAPGTGVPLIVERIDAAGRATLLATIDPPKVDGVLDNVTGLVLTPTTWVLAAQFRSEPDTEGTQRTIDHEVGEAIVSGPIGGGATATVLQCTLDVKLDQEHNETPELAVSADRVAWSQSLCPGAGGVRVAPIGGGPSISVAAAGSTLGLTPSSVVLGVADTASRLPLLSQLDLATGATVMTNPLSVHALAAGDDGLVVSTQDNPDCTRDVCPESLTRIAADGTIIHPGIAAVDSFPGLVIGGGRALTGRPGDDGLVAVDLATGARSYAAAIGRSARNLVPLAVDATRATYLTQDCSGDDVVRSEDTVATAPKPLRSVPCPVRFRSGITYDVGADSGSIRVSCPRGCGTSWNINYHGRRIGDFTGFEPAGHTGTALIEIDHPAALGHLRSITVQVSDGSTDYPFAPHQAPVRLRMRIR
jgi:hypothetical protein